MNKIFEVFTVLFVSLIQPKQVVAAIIPPPVAQIKILNSYNSNVNRNNLINAGTVISTNSNGYLEASVVPFGVNLIKLWPSSQLQLLSSGSGINGARTIVFNVRGQARFYTRLTNPYSEVKVCLGAGRGCAKLYSNVKIKEIENGKYVLGTNKGRAIVQDEAEKLEPAIVSTGQYSIMEKDGVFSFPKKVNLKNTHFITHQTKTVKTYDTLPGYSILTSNKITKKAQIIVGVPFKILSPLDDK